MLAMHRWSLGKNFEVLRGPWGWKATLLSSTTRVHNSQHVVSKDPPHLRPSREDELKVAKAFKLFPIHGPVQVLVGRFHKGLKDHPGLNVRRPLGISKLNLWPWKSVEDGCEKLSEGVDHLRRFSQSSKTLNDLLQAHLLVPWLGCKELENALSRSHGLHQSYQTGIESLFKLNIFNV